MPACVVYFSATAGNAIVSSNQQQLFQLLDAHRVEYELIDCSDPANKDARNAAWAVSGRRAVCALVCRFYP
jgi:hypothetical protein